MFRLRLPMLHAHATGGNVIKAGLVSLLSSPLTSFGIGKLYGSTGSIGKELLRAGTHALASGLASAIDGGNFGSFASGFISGGASAMFMYGSMKGLSPGDLTDSQRMSLGFKAALIGGGVSLITGGNFLKGALFGFSIAMFNYAEGFPPMEYYDEDGYEYTELPDVIVLSKVSKGFLDLKSMINLWTNAVSYSNATIESFGKGLKKYGGNSTFGSNGKGYWKTSTQRPFNGNQYVTTQKLTAIGGKITNITGTVGHSILAIQLGFGISQDIMDFVNYGYTDGYNSIRALVSFGGAWAGMDAGIYIGGAIGSLFGGVGAIPGSIIGATVGGLAGAFLGTIAGEEAVDWMYGK